MKKKYLISFLIYCISLFIGSSLYSQEIVIEEGNRDLYKIDYNSNFDKSDYTKVLDEQDKKIYVANHVSDQNPQRSDLGIESNVTLSLNLFFDETQFNSSPVLVRSDNGYFDYGFWDGSNPITFNVPDGDNYDFIIDFVKQSTNQRHIVMKEMIAVAGNTSVDADVAEAQNYVSLNMVDETGTIIEPGIPNSESGKYSRFELESMFIYNPTNHSFSLKLYGIDYTVPGEPMWSFFINDFSERFTFIHNAVVRNYKDGYYFLKFQNVSNVSGNVDISNDPSKWAFHQEKFEPSLLGATNNLNKGYSALKLRNGVIQGQTISVRDDPLDPSEPITLWLNNPLDGVSSDFLISPVLVDYKAEIDPARGEERFFIMGNLIFSGNDGEVQYASGNITVGNRYYDGLNYYQSTGRKILPFHPKFSFSSNQPQRVIQGSNVPIFTYSTISGEFSGLYKGRYGESRESDLLATDVTVKQNGNIVFSGTYLDFLSFSVPYGVEIDFSNTNTNVFGLNGTNNTKLTYNPEGDNRPPTLQMLQFRDTDGNVADRFSSASEGTVRLAAGDFAVSGHIIYKPGNIVKMFYSIHNENEWTELDLVKDPSFFQMPAFGDYYEGSLASITNTEEDVWYDAKIICTDASGNKQEQVLSPAFKINDTFLNIEEVTTASELSIYPNPFSDELNIILPSNVNGDYFFKVIDVTGKTIYSRTQSEKFFVWDTSFLAKGVYILSIESNEKSMVRKVIRK